MKRVFLVVMLAWLAVTALSQPVIAEMALLKPNRSVHLGSDDTMRVVQDSVKPPESPRYAPDEVVFKLKETGAKAQAMTGDTHAILGQIAGKHELAEPRALIANRARGPWKNVFRARLRPGASPLEASAILQADPAVEWAEPNYYRYTSAVPNDPSYGYPVPSAPDQ